MPRLKWSLSEKYSDRYYEFGIAEQNMLTASGAMAAEGYCIFAVGYSPFLSMRALEQIRTFVAYPNLNVKVVAGLSGLSGDTDGVTHQGTEDVGIVRTIPNMTLLCPADAAAARAFPVFTAPRTVCAAFASSTRPEACSCIRYPPFLYQIGL